MTTSSATSNNNKTVRTVARICGYVLFAMGIFFTFAAIISLPLIFAIMFSLIIVGGILLILWGNKGKK